MTTTPVSNSYITDIETLESMLASDPRPAAIALLAADSTTQTWYLQRATKIIDNMPLKGSTYKYIDKSSPSSDEQSLMFPRIINGLACDWDDSTSEAIVPELVKAACVEEAIGLYEFYTSSSDQKRAKMQRQGVSSFSIGDLSESYKAGASRKLKGLKSEAAYDLLKEYIAGAVRPIP